MSLAAEDKFTPPPLGNSPEHNTMYLYTGRGHTGVFPEIPSPPRTESEKIRKKLLLYFLAASVVTLSFVSLCAFAVYSKPLQVTVEGGREPVTVHSSSEPRYRAKPEAVISVLSQPDPVEEAPQKASITDLQKLISQSSSQAQPASKNTDSFRTARYLSETILHESRLKDRGAAKELAEKIITAANNSGIDPLFVAAVVYNESTFDSSVKSKAGKIGLMQISPILGKDIASLTGMEWLGKKQLFNPDYNLKLGTSYLSYLKNHLNLSERQTLLAYNWDRARLIKAINDNTLAPNSTRRYATKVQLKFKRLKEGFEKQKKSL